MTALPFRRPARRNGPELPQGEVALQEPPALPEVQPTGLRALMMILPMMLMSGGMMSMYMRGGNGSSGAGGSGMLMMGMMGAGMLAMAVSQLLNSGGDRRYRIGGSRRDYLRYLSQTRRTVRRYADQQRAALAWKHPDPQSLWSVAMTSRLWERRPSHPDFGELRIGTGPQRLAVRMTPMQTKPMEDLEPVSAKALRRFIKAYTTVPDQPVAMYIRGFARIQLTGDADTGRALLRALIAQLATLHGPDEARIAICAADENAEEWSWTKWLPHAQHPTERDAAGPVRLFGDTLDEAERLLGEEFRARPRFSADADVTRDEPFVLVVVDGGSVPSGSRFLESGYRNAVLVDLNGRHATTYSGGLRLDVAEQIEMVERDRTGRERRTTLANPDGLSLPRMASLARVLARHQAGAPGEQIASGLTADLDLPTLLRLNDIEHFDARAEWLKRSASQRLRVPIGVADDGTPIELDIKESAEGGMGPHGMLIGATGSGKSELLRTLVSALACTHSSETLNFVLVDFKGGATFAGLDALPHVSALITNLADEAAMVERMRDALHGELVRRQELLRRAGNFASVRDYEAARAGGAALEPLPSLFVVVDEFSELIATHADFIELFVMIGRLGRSLGVHLLLASQRLDDGRIHQLESHLSYRIGLRTFSASESRSVIGVPDAYELPSEPGNGYLRSDVATIVRFKAAYVSGTYRPRRASVQQDVIQRQVVSYGTEYLPVETAPVVDLVEEAPSDTDKSATSVMSVLIDRLIDQGPPAHQVWLPPLEQSPTLDQILPPLLPDPEHGLRPVNRGNGLQVPLGLIDKPFEQVRDLLVADLSGVGGHVGIAGGPQSGKSTLLLSLISALALTNSPREVNFYCLDFGGGVLSSLNELPHVGGIATRSDADRVNRTVAEVTAMLVQREQRFAELGVNGMAEYRAALPAGDADTGAEIFLMVDGWFTLRQEFEAAETALRELSARGLNYGVHLVLTAGRWTEVHHSMRDKLGTRLELRLGDPVESAIDLRAAAQVPKRAGRGLTDTKLHFLGVLPRIDGNPDPTDISAAIRDLAGMVADCWSGDSASAVRTLPLSLSAAQLPAADGDIRIALGLDEARLEPFWHDFRSTPHLTVLGDSQSGKTNLLRLVARNVAARFDAREARIMAVDYRRELFEEIPEQMRLGYAVSAETTKQSVAEAVAGLQGRIPGPDVTPEQLRRRDWWQGPLLFVLVDDYDLLAGGDNPLSGLLPLLPQARDIGLHIVLTRAAAGVMRMGMDPVLRRLQELNTPDVALSCPPSEGPLLGNVKPRQLPTGRALVCTRRGATLIQTAEVAVSVPA